MNVLSKGVFALLLVSVLLVSWGCTKSTSQKEDSLNNRKEIVSIVSRFRACEDIAQYHSKALEYVYATQISVANRYEVNEMNEVSEELEAFVSQSSVVNDLKEAVVRLCLATPISELRSQQILDRNKVESLFEDFCSNVDLEHLSSYIQEYIQGDVFVKASVPEQNLLLMRIALYKDSFNYWKKEYPNWLSVHGGNMRAFDGGEKNDDNGGGFWSTIKTTLEKLGSLAKADALGSSIDAMVEAGIDGAGGGALAGAVAGSAAGGAGALPGAASGAVIGGLGSAAGKFISDAAKASTEAARESSSGKGDK